MVGGWRRDIEGQEGTLVTVHRVLSVFQWRKGKRCACTGVDKAVEYIRGIELLYGEKCGYGGMCTVRLA